MLKPKRNRVDEVLEKTAREGRSAWKYTADRKLEQLVHLWNTGEHIALADFFPMRIVTLLEVFCRRWLAQIIDHGSPFLERAPGLVPDMKFDYAIALALQGQRITVGRLIAHQVPLNNVVDMSNHFSKLIDHDFFVKLGATRDPFVPESMATGLPMIADIDDLKRTLVTLFSVRHIVTHESPETAPYNTSDVSRFLADASTFMRAADAMLFVMLHPDYRRTTLDDNQVASDELQCAAADLEALINEIKARPHYGPDHELLETAQSAWSAYASAQANLRSSTCRGGSLETGIHLRELTRLGRQRIEDLRWWNEREEGEI